MVGGLTLSDFLAAHPADAALVPPLVHVTDGTNLPNIIADGGLEPDKSKIAEDRRAIYLSVGKPAYLLKPKSQSEFFDAPVVFVFDRLSYGSVDQICATDSGALQAASGNRFANIVGDMSLSDFLVEPSRSSVAAIIQVFFGSNESYVKSKPKSIDELFKQYEILPSSFRVLALAALYNATMADHSDGRKSAIEASATRQFPLTSFLRGVVLPEEWLSDFAIRDPLEKMGCIVQSYELWPINRAHYQSELFRNVQIIARRL